MMRLVLVGPVYPYRGGIAHYTTMLLQALRGSGHEVLLASFKRQYPRWLFPGRNDKDPSLQALTVEGARFWIDPLNPVTWVTTARRIELFRPDATVLQWWTSFWGPAWFTLASLYRLLVRGPLIVICHNVLPHEPRWWDARLARAVLGCSTLVVVQSTAQRDELLRLVPGKRVAVVPHPIYDMFAHQRISKAEARRRLNLPENAPILLFFGFVREYKGLKDVMLALPGIRDRLGRVILLVAGEFWEDKQSYCEMIEQLALTDSVVLHDRYIPNEEVALYFSAADLLVAPYRTATGSGVIQMAIGFGLPVVTSAAVIGQTGSDSELVSCEGPNDFATAVVDQLRKDDRPLPGKRPDANRGNGWDALVRCIEEECVP
jgi:glycosyltransferase involved in cell wall biosynthesis